MQEHSVYLARAARSSCAIARGHSIRPGVEAGRYPAPPSVIIAEGSHVWSAVRHVLIRILVVALLIVCPPHASAYSVLSHEASVDALWKTHLRQLIHRRFPAASAEEIESARAFAYGGSVIQDLGYY